MTGNKKGFCDDGIRDVCFTLRTVLGISSFGTRRSGDTLKMTGLISRRLKQYIGPGDDTIKFDGGFIRKSPAVGGRRRRWRQLALPVAPAAD